MTSPTRALAELKVPRYTSYPTAPHFSSAVTAEQHALWLAMLKKSASLSLYLHVPYCAVLCHYCGCHTKAVRQRAPVDAYADQLAREIVQVGNRMGAHRVTHVHWGGGTPSLLGPERIAELVGWLNQAFRLTPGCEHVFELDPRHVTPQLAGTLAALGVNRVSLGVQEFAPHVQAAIGRIQPFAVVERAVHALREAGITRINFDLMYGLPGQTADDIRRSIALTAQLAAQRVAYFGYAHVPWMKTHQRLIDEAMLPGVVERLEQAATGHAALIEAGYQAIGLDHFARPDDALALAARAGTLRRNFQGYTTDAADALIGFGASAISSLPQGFVQNAPDVGGYARAIADERLPTARGIAVTTEDRLRGRIIERLMCDFAVDLAALAGSQSDAPDFTAELAELAPLADEGLVQLAGHTVTVTEAGRPFVRLVAAAFDTYLASGRARHSLAV
jgi:oxygen-independent coproporphyrinogen-3 oxidase